MDTTPLSSLPARTLHESEPVHRAAQEPAQVPVQPQARVPHSLSSLLNPIPDSNAPSTTVVSPVIDLAAGEAQPDNHTTSRPPSFVAAPDAITLTVPAPSAPTDAALPSTTTTTTTTPAVSQLALVRSTSTSSTTSSTLSSTLSSSLADPTAPPTTTKKPTSGTTRRRTSPAEKAVLESHFQRDPMPDAEKRGEIARECGMKVREVQIWMQNRRQKAKKMHASSASSGTSTSSSVTSSPALHTAPLSSHLTSSGPATSPLPVAPSSALLADGASSPLPSSRPPSSSPGLLVQDAPKDGKVLLPNGEYPSVLLPGPNPSRPLPSPASLDKAEGKENRSPVEHGPAAEQGKRLGLPTIVLAPLRDLDHASSARAQTYSHSAPPTATFPLPSDPFFSASHQPTPTANANGLVSPDRATDNANAKRRKAVQRKKAEAKAARKLAFGSNGTLASTGVKVEDDDREEGGKVSPLLASPASFDHSSGRTVFAPLPPTTDALPPTTAAAPGLTKKKSSLNLKTSHSGHLSISDAFPLGGLEAKHSTTPRRAATSRLAMEILDRMPSSDPIPFEPSSDAAGSERGRAKARREEKRSPGKFDPLKQSIFGTGPSGPLVGLARSASASIFPSLGNASLGARSVFSRPTAADGARLGMKRSASLDVVAMAASTTSGLKRSSSSHSHAGAKRQKTAGKDVKAKKTEVEETSSIGLGLTIPQDHAQKSPVRPVLAHSTSFNCLLSAVNGASTSPSIAHRPSSVSTSSFATGTDGMLVDSPVDHEDDDFDGDATMVSSGADTTLHSDSDTPSSWSVENLKGCGKLERVDVKVLDVHGCDDRDREGAELLLGLGGVFA